MEKGLARFRVSLLCFCCGWFCCGCFVAAGLLQLVCCGCFVAAALLRCFVALPVLQPRPGPVPFYGCQCLLRLFATSALRALQPRPGTVPSREPMPPAAVRHLSAAGHSNRVLVHFPFREPMSPCGCLPPQRCRYSNRVLVQCPIGLPMPPATVCHLSAAGALQPRPGPVPF